MADCFTRVEDINCNEVTMAKIKRPHEGDLRAEMDDVHPSRKKRVKYSDEDAQLATIYDDLADEVQEVRIKAAGDLVKNLSTWTSDFAARQDAAEKRLIKGLCSGRKAARLGFSIALTEVFRQKLKSGEENELADLLDRIAKLTQPEGNVSGQERRDHLIGRRFALQAVLQSDIALRMDLPDDQWDSILRHIFQLGAEKPWLRRDCGSMVYEYLESRGSKLSTSRIRNSIKIASEHQYLKTPEGVGLWLIVQHSFPEVKLPTGIWHNNDPLTSKERATLSKVLLEDIVSDDQTAKRPGTRQSNLSFVWAIIFSTLFGREEPKEFGKFWDQCVVSTMFSSSSSTERRSLGLQVFTLAIGSAPLSQLQSVCHPNIIRCILDQRADPNRYLFEAAKDSLNQLVSLAKQNPEAVSVLVRNLLFKGAVNFDQLSKTKTIESLIQYANKTVLKELVAAVSAGISNPATGIESQDEQRRRAFVDVLLSMVRSHKDSRTSLRPTLSDTDTESDSWLRDVLHALSAFAYDESSSSSSRSVFRARLMSCLNILMDPPLEQATRAPVLAAWHALKYTAAKEGDNKTVKHAIKDAKSCLKSSYKRQSKSASSQVFSLLLALSILQVYNGEPDAVSVLEDLVACYRTEGESDDSTTMLVELLLSFISKPSSLFRKLAEQVFAVLAPEITADSLQSLTDILAQKESLSGQKELFNDGDDEDEEPASDDEDVEAMDVEDASDVEFVNGEVPTAQESSDEDSDSSSEAEEGATSLEDDEEAAFDKKLADALGTAGMDDDSDEDGSDMDDEQMMALEPHLATIFKERQKKSSKKQDRKDAKENIVNFKNRVLGLLNIYVKAHCGSVLALDLILPLTTLVRTTTSKPTGEKAFAVLKQYFESCNKNKSLPKPEDHEACFAVLAALHEEMKLGGSKLHANACSRSSLFLAKGLVALDRKHYRRIADMYAELQSEWYSDRKSKVQGSVFTEWTSWSITTRK